MAPLNPSPQPTQDYPYFWSKPTQEPKPDISGEIKGKAIGTALDEGGSAIREGAQGINAAYEKGIQNTIYAAVDPLRDQYMERLHSTDQALQGRDTPDPLGRDAPRDVKGLPNTLNTLDSARANGKLSQTDYDARLNALAKEVRAKYPGYRSYVDEEFKRITGRDSANQYIRSVIQDVDSYQANKKSEGSKLENRILEAGGKYPGANFYYQKVQQDPDKWGPKAIEWLFHNQAEDHALEMAEKKVNFLKATDQYDKEKQGRAQDQGVNESAAHYYTNRLDMISGHLDIDPDTNTRMGDVLGKMRRGEAVGDVKPEDAVKLRTFLQQQIPGMMSERAADLQHAFPDMKEEDIQKTIKAEIETQYQPYMDALGKGDFSTAESLKNLIKARNLQAGSQAYNDPKWGHTISFVSGLREIDPSLANTFDIQLGGQATPELMAHYATSTAAIASPPEKGGKSFAQTLQDLHVQNVTDGKLHKSLIETYATVATKGPQAISNESADALINSAFGPESANVLQAFAKEGTGRGKNLGAEYVYNTFTSEGMVDRIAKRAKENPALYENYRNWVGSNVRYLLTDHALKEAPPEPSDRISTAAQALGQRPEIKSSYNDSTQTFSFTANGKSVNRPDLNTLSQVLKRAAEVAKGDPNHDIDPTRSVYDILQSMRAPEGSTIYNMIKAMEATRQ
jgi:hypothetical protein